MDGSPRGWASSASLAGDELVVVVTPADARVSVTELPTFKGIDGPGVGSYRAAL